MWTDIFIKNKKFLLSTLKLFLKDIDLIKDKIKKSKAEEIFNLLKRTKEVRKSIVKKGI